MRGTSCSLPTTPRSSGTGSSIAPRTASTIARAAPLPMLTTMRDDAQEGTMRPVDFDSVALMKGSHRRREDGVCAMELVAWIAGEPHSDAPRCACPVLTAFVTHLNDTLDDEPRNR